MFARVITVLAVAAALAWPAVAKAAPEGEILIDRRGDQVSLYFAMPAPLLETVFGQSAEPLLGADGTVDIDGLYDGTYLLADDIFAGARLRIGGEDVPVEALSMMLHDPAFLPGFDDPYDAQVSIAVCTSPETVRGMGLPELDAYLGYFAWKVDGHQTIEITFPETGRSDVTFSVRNYADFQLVGVQNTVVPDGGTIQLPSAAATETPGFAEAASFGFMVFGFALGLIYFGRRTMARPESDMKGSP